MKIRPSRLPNKSDVSIDNVGCIVNAWLHDGWCEGIVVHKESDDKIHYRNHVWCTLYGSRGQGQNWIGTEIVVEDTLEYEDGGEIVVREMVPYEFDSVLLRYLRQAIQESLKRAKDVVHTAKNIEIQKLCLPHLIHNPK
ncbi:agenet domain-containing protein [Tanacetum coccineum]